MDDLSIAAFRELIKTEADMDVGMLWFDNEPRLDLETKVLNAAKYYRKKYGEEANYCFVHPSMVCGGKPDTSPIVLNLNSTVLPHHFWIGVHHDTDTIP